MRAAQCIALILALASPVEAQSDKDVAAKRLFLRGKQQYSAAQYEQAIASFKAAGAIRPSPILDYNVGRCYDKLDRAAEAIAAYRRYLAATTEDTHRDEIQGRIAALKKKMAAPRDPYADLEQPRPPASVPASLPSTPEEPGLVAPPPARVPSPPPPHEASLPPAWDGNTSSTTRAPVASRPPPQRPSPPPPPSRDSGPVYKQWWFWVACAGGAVIAGFIIGIAATSHSDSASRTSGLQVHF
jgi:hypothetical protein